jgi:hypothetical protein
MTRTYGFAILFVIFVAIFSLVPHVQADNFVSCEGSALGANANGGFCSASCAPAGMTQVWVIANSCTPYYPNAVIPTATAATSFVSSEIPTGQVITSTIAITPTRPLTQPIFKIKAGVVPTTTAPTASLPAGQAGTNPADLPGTAVTQPLPAITSTTTVSSLISAAGYMTPTTFPSITSTESISTVVFTWPTTQSAPAQYKVRKGLFWQVLGIGPWYTWPLVLTVVLVGNKYRRFKRRRLARYEVNAEIQNVAGLPVQNRTIIDVPWYVAKWYRLTANPYQWAPNGKSYGYMAPQAAELARSTWKQGFRLGAIALTIAFILLFLLFAYIRANAY